MYVHELRYYLTGVSLGNSDLVALEKKGELVNIINKSAAL